MAALFDRHEVRLFRHACRLLTAREDAKDAVTIAFFELWRKRSSVRLVDGSPLPWLLNTVSHSARNRPVCRMAASAPTRRTVAAPSATKPPLHKGGRGAAAAIASVVDGEQGGDGPVGVEQRLQLAAGVGLGEVKVLACGHVDQATPGELVDRLPPPWRAGRVEVVEDDLAVDHQLEPVVADGEVPGWCGGGSCPDTIECGEELYSPLSALAGILAATAAQLWFVAFRLGRWAKGRSGSGGAGRSRPRVR